MNGLALILITLSARYNKDTGRPIRSPAAENAAE